MKGLITITPQNKFDFINTRANWETVDDIRTQLSSANTETRLVVLHELIRTITSNSYELITPINLFELEAQLTDIENKHGEEH